MPIGENGFWSDSRIMSYHQKPIKTALTFRGPGKSYGRKFNIMHRALQHDETTLCLYRKPQDLRFAKNSWIGPLINPDPEDEQHKGYDPKKFKFTGDKYLSSLYYDGKPICQFMSLESVNSIKQMHFSPNTCWVWFDEFIPLKYIKLAGIDNEGDAFKTIVDTIDHKYKDNRQDYGLPPINCILYGNPVNGMTPLVEYLGIDPFKYGVYKPKKEVVVEHIAPGKKQMDDPNCLRDVRNFVLAYDKLAYVKNIPKGAKPWISIRIGEPEHYYTYYISKGNTWVQQTNKHKGVIHYGKIDLRTDEKTLDPMFSDLDFKILQNQTIACEQLYSDYTTKFNFLHDIIHPAF